MASETVDPIDSSHPPPYTGQYPLSSTYCTLQCGLGCKSQNLLHWVSRERATFGMPDQRTACAATQSMLHTVILYVNVRWIASITCMSFTLNGFQSWLQYSSIGMTRDFKSVRMRERCHDFRKHSQQPFHLVYGLLNYISNMKSESGRVTHHYA